MDLLQRAIAIATELHEGQTRKGTDPPIPYITHPLEVMELVRAHGGSEIEQAGAVCHDVAEDAGGHQVLERLHRELGKEVADIVAGCSDSLEAVGVAKAPWQERKDVYLKHLRAATPSTLLVSCADKLANARAIVRELRDERVGAAVWQRFSAGKERQLWYYGALAEIFAERLPGPLAAELTATVAEMRGEALRRG
jgi:(p)ppGpp synthase/HD superfamily hydrolase